VTFITNQESTDLRYHKMMYNLDEVVVPNLNYSMLDPESAEQNFFEIAAKQSIRSQLKIFSHLSGQVNRVLDQTYSDAGVQSVLRHGQFDLLLLSQVVSYAGYPLAWHFQCPFILSSPNVLMTDSAYLLGDSEHTVMQPEGDQVFYRHFVLGISPMFLYNFEFITDLAHIFIPFQGVRPFLSDGPDGPNEFGAARNQHGRHSSAQLLPGHVRLSALAAGHREIFPWGSFLD
jgi:hypothetical protein